MTDVFEQMLSRYDFVTNEDRFNATHEVMQQITLAALNRSGFYDKAAFYGGTCLRIFHNLARFSEDLDFSLLQKNEYFNIENYFDSIYDEFKACGKEVTIIKKQKKNDTPIESAFLKENTDIYNIQFQNEKTVKIKIEVDKNPPLKFDSENKLLMLPYSFMTNCFSLPSLYAEKLHALLFRNWKTRIKGRDCYDFEWYIRKGCKLNFEHLKERALQTGYIGNAEFTPKLFKELLKDKIQNTKIEIVKSDVSPFVKNKKELDIWSTDYFLQLVDMIQIEK